MIGPIASGFNRTKEARRGRARVRRLERIKSAWLNDVRAVLLCWRDGAYLDQQWIVLFSSKHPIEDHPCYFTRDDILGDPEGNFLIRSVRQEPQQVMINPV